MASDMFMKVDGIEGESTDANHTNHIDILSWGFSATNAGSMGHGGGGGTGKGDFGDISVTKMADKSTPKLLQACARGDHVRKVEIFTRKASGQGGQVEFLILTLTDVLFSGYNMSSSSGDAVPHESISLNYAEIKYEYKPQNADGSLGGTVPMSYNRHTNVAT